LGHTLRHSQKNAFGSDFAVSESVKDAYERAMHFQQQDEEEKDMAPTPTTPSYVSRQQEVKWRQQYEFDKDESVRICYRIVRHCCILSSPIDLCPLF
jgi:hypothetical protein